MGQKSATLCFFKCFFLASTDRDTRRDKINTLYRKSEILKKLERRQKKCHQKELQDNQTRVLQKGTHFIATDANSVDFKSKLECTMNTGEEAARSFSQYNQCVDRQLQLPK